jgi:ATP phosphoribosyltransferase
VIRLDGAVENAVGLGLADDRRRRRHRRHPRAGLELVDVVLSSCAVLVRAVDAAGNGPVTQLVRRLNGVLVAAGT